MKRPVVDLWQCRTASFSPTRSLRPSPTETSTITAPPFDKKPCAAPPWAPHPYQTALSTRKPGNRLKQQQVDAETGDPVEKEDIGRGYEIGKGQYLQIEDDELEKIRTESTHTIEIDSFVPRSEIDDRYLDSPYYIAPTAQVGQEAFAVIRDAIREKGMVALGRVVVSRREYVVMLEAFDKGLLAATLRYSDEVRDHAAYFEDIPDLKLPAEMKQLAAHIVDTKASHFDSSKFIDHYETALVEILTVCPQTIKRGELIRGGH